MQARMLRRGYFTGLHPSRRRHSRSKNGVALLAYASSG